MTAVGGSTPSTTTVLVVWGFVAALGIWAWMKVRRWRRRRRDAVRQRAILRDNEVLRRVVREEILQVMDERRAVREEVLRALGGGGDEAARSPGDASRGAADPGGDGGPGRTGA